MLDIWDESLADKGVRIIKKRKDFVDRLSLISENIHSSITNGKERSEIEYHPNIEYIEDIEDNKKLFLEELKESRQRDLEQGSTHRG